MKRTVADLMTREVKTLRIGDTLDLAEDVMRLERIRHLPVVDGQGHLVGLVTHRDLLGAWVSRGIPWKETHREVAMQVPIEMMMTKGVQTVVPDAPAGQAAQQLLKNRFGCLPVVDESGKLVGIITEADFVVFAAAYFDAEN